MVLRPSPGPPMKKALVLVSVLVGSTVLALRALSGPAAAAGEPTGPLASLKEGNERFVNGELQHAHQTFERVSAVAKGQHPFAVIVGCADSRVPPEIVFDQGIGDLFVVRIAGGVLGDAAIGSIEYAVEHLGCELVVVLGHERCGAVGAVLQGERLPGHLAAFVPAIDPILAEARRRGGDVLDNAVRLNAELVADELRTSKPILAEAVHGGELTVLAARYDLDTGEVEWLDEHPGRDERAAMAPAHASH